MEKPEWLKRISQSLRFIAILNMAFEEECGCPVCQELRKLAIEMEAMRVVEKARRGKGRD